MTLTRAEMAAELDRLNRRSASLPTRPGTCGKPGCTIDHDATLRLLREQRSAPSAPVVRDAAFEQRKARRMAMTGGLERLISSRDPRVVWQDYVD